LTNPVIAFDNGGSREWMRIYLSPDAYFKVLSFYCKIKYLSNGTAKIKNVKQKQKFCLFLGKNLNQTRFVSGFHPQKDIRGRCHPALNRCHPERSEGSVVRNARM